jgi:V/A-type H+-transporting ATPase subunit B
VQSSKVRFLGKTLEVAVSPISWGASLTAPGIPSTAGPKIIPEKTSRHQRNPINPFARAYPSEFIQTGISGIDCMNPLVARGRASHLLGFRTSHAQIAAQIARQATVLGSTNTSPFVLRGVGITFENRLLYVRLPPNGRYRQSVLFVKLANDPVIERIRHPRMALTVAEYLAFERDMLCTSS